MRWAAALVLPLLLLAGCVREPQRVPARDGWRVADVPAGGSVRVDIFEIQRESLTRLEGHSSSGRYTFRPKLAIEPRDGPVRGAVRIRGAAGYTGAAVGPTFLLPVSFDGGPAEPVAFQRDSVDLTAPRSFADRLQRHRTMSIDLRGGDRFHPAGVVTFRLEGLAPQLAALDAELHARRKAAAPLSLVVNALLDALGG